MTDTDHIQSLTWGIGERIHRMLTMRLDQGILDPNRRGEHLPPPPSSETAFAAVCTR